MSLIHEALKKAEAEKKPADPLAPRLPNPIIPDRRKMQTGTLVLIILLGVSLLFLVYTRFLKKSFLPATPQPGISQTGMVKKTDDPLQLKAMGLKLFHESRLEQSLVIWERLTLLTPTEAEVYNNMGLVLKKLGKKEEAYQAYTRALALRKEYPEALNNLGVLILSDGQGEKAKGYFEEALKLSGNYADPHLHLALIFEQQGNSAQAVEHYKKFLEFSPQISEEWKTKILNKIDRLSK